MKLKKSSSKAVSARRKRIKELAVSYKGGVCRNCGYDRYIGALEFHHVKPEKKEFAISHYGHCRSWERVKRELDKCVLLCSNCHREAEAGYFDCEGMEKFNVEVEDIKKYPIPRENFCVDCEEKIDLKPKRCLPCYKIYRSKNEKVKNKPNKEELIQMIVKDKMSFLSIGRKYGVSDAAIRKWCVKQGVPYRRKDIEIFKKTLVHQ